MKLYNKIIIILSLIVIFIYVCNITLLPTNIILNEGEILNLKTIYGITVNGIENGGLTRQASSNLNNKKINDAGSLEVSLNLFGKISIKEMNVSVIPKTTVIPIGKAIGLKLYTDGVLVVGMSEINGKKPYEDSDIQEGDMIVAIDDEKIENTDDLIKAVNNCDGECVEITYKREEETKITSIEPVKTNENEYKLGLWVRDAAAGVRYDDFL